MPYNLTSSDIKSAIFPVSFKSKIGISRPDIGESEATPLMDELVKASKGLLMTRRKVSIFG